MTFKIGQKVIMRDDAQNRIHCTYRNYVGMIGIVRSFPDPVKGTISVEFCLQDNKKHTISAFPRRFDPAINYLDATRQVIEDQKNDKN